MIFVITQNEAATLPKDSRDTICTINLTSGVAVVMRGENGFTLLHASHNTDLNFIPNEIARLGPGIKIKLYKKNRGAGELEESIINFLETHNIAFDFEDFDYVPAAGLPYGIVKAIATWDGEPRTEIILALLKGESLGSTIDYGPENIHIRTYKQRIAALLNPDRQLAPCLIYANKTWNKSFEFSSNDLVLYSYLADVSDNPEKLKQRILDMLLSAQPEYAARFRITSILYKLDNKQVINAYTVLLPKLITDAKNYCEQTKQSLEPTPKLTKSLLVS